MAGAFEGGGEKHVNDLVSKRRRHDPGTDRQHIRVVVLACHAGGVQVVTQRRAHATDFVGSDLLALAGTTHHNPKLGVAVHNETPDFCANRRVVASVERKGAAVVDIVAGCAQGSCDMRLQFVSGMIRADCNVHLTECRRSRSDFPWYCPR